MTQRPSPPDRGWTNPQRLLPESGNTEDVRRALNRVYDQLDRISTDNIEVREQVTPRVRPTTPGARPSADTGGGGTTVTPGDGGTATGGGSTGGGTTTPVERPPVTFHIPANIAGTLSIDQDGYVAMQSITI
jgi:hypothetical protein